MLKRDLPTSRFLRGSQILPDAFSAHRETEALRQIACKLPRSILAFCKEKDGLEHTDLVEQHLDSLSRKGQEEGIVLLLYLDSRIQISTQPFDPWALQEEPEELNEAVTLHHLRNLPAGSWLSPRAAKRASREGPLLAGGL